MKHLLLILCLAIPSLAQVVIEVPCPSGTQVLQFGSAYDPTQGGYKQWACVDGAGNVFLQPNQLNVTVNYSTPQLYDGVFACNGVAASCAIGMFAGTAPTGCCSQAAVGVLPTQTNPFYQMQYQNNVASTSGTIGLLHIENGSNGLFNYRAFWTLTHKLSITAITNTRYYWGLGVWNSGSTIGTNATNLIGTTAFSTDTINHSMVGWTWSAGTYATFEGIVCQAGATPTTLLLNTGVIADSNLHTFNITLDGPNTTFTFYIDGKNVGNLPASTLIFSPTNLNDTLAALFFTGDAKNTTTPFQVSFASMFITPRQ